MAGPLDGIKVADFTEYIAGPYCTMMLADMGAEVVKVERPDGDPWRHTAALAPGQGRMFLAVNRGKRSLALDLNRAEGRELAHDLVRASDVVVISHRRDAADRMALDYETVSALNPQAVYCDVSAFGTEGPLRHRAGFDILVQGLSSMITYESKLERGVPTHIASLEVGDVTTGMFMAFAIATALYARTNIGRGQHISASLLGSILAAQSRILLSVEQTDAPVREGFLAELESARKDGATFEYSSNLRSQYVAIRGRNNYYHVYETKDGLTAVACLNNRQRRALRDALGVSDPTVSGETYDWFSDEIRVAQEHTAREFEVAFKSRTTAECVSTLNDAGVPCGEVLFTEEVYGHPQVVANDYILNLSHPILGPLRLPGSPIRMDITETGSDLPPPLLGADGPATMQKLGYDDATIERLIEQRVVITPDIKLSD